MSGANQVSSKIQIARSDEHKYKFAAPHQKKRRLIMSKEFSKGENISQKVKVTASKLISFTLQSNDKTFNVRVPRLISFLKVTFDPE